MVYKKYSYKPAFTIVELLVVIVVIGILATITIISYTGISSRATAASLQSDLDNSSKLIKLYQIEHSVYPTSFDANNCPTPSDIRYCIKPSNGTTYVYKASTTNPNIFCITATKNNQSYNISSDNFALAGPCPVMSLEASNKTSYPGNGTIWADLSGFDNNGTLNNNINYTNSNGGALIFDGSSNQVTVGNPAPIQIAGINNFSVSAWIYSTQFKCGVYAIDKSNNTLCGTATNGGWILGGNSSTFGFQVSDHANLRSQYLSFNSLLNTWYYLVGVRNGNLLSLYVNGVLNTTGDVTGYVIDDNNNLTIGGNTPTWAFSGRVGNVNIYNKALSSDEIFQIFNSTKGRYGF